MISKGHIWTLPSNDQRKQIYFRHIYKIWSINKLQSTITTKLNIENILIKIQKGQKPITIRKDTNGEGEGVQGTLYTCTGFSQ
jgi:hypothetical protein